MTSAVEESCFPVFDPKSSRVPAPGGRGAQARTRITVTGVVHGAGFRPFVHRVATELGLTGFVGNDAAAVFIEAQGPADALAKLSSGGTTPGTPRMGGT